ncbi:Secretory immunoglobulin A-binding protein EsiB [Durusdinium trenchii]|uniref:Secretory immunoglobulin A-binding protein EsiB n=1 Tax=Durusdinium trenchii TaxID=1381693 RepID=A0ABP0MAH9_9DINO
MKAYIERAVDLIQTGELALARTYLAPALIHPRLSPGERSRAYYLRGYSYYAAGLPVSASKDYARALEFNPANGAALVALGGLYHRGEGVDEDAEIAFAFFETAAEAEHPEANLYVGFALLEGRGVAQDVARAREILQKEAEAGDSTAMLYLGRSYRADYTEEPNVVEAQRWIEAAAAADSIEAQVALGYMHYKGEFNGEPDLVAAVRLFEAAGEAGSSAADVALGHMYLVGEGVPMDPATARELLERAALAGNLAGSLSLGHIYEAGIGVDADLEAAEAWYLRGAQAGFSQAQLRLFYLLLRRGEELEALHWIAKAADQNLPQAQNDYAWMLSTSRSEDVRNGALALSYAERAVAQVESAAYLDTLAAAYAELGRFAEAVATQEQAMALITEAGSEEALALAEHLAAYEAGEPWRE